MARLWSSSSNVRRIIHTILADLGRKHPSALLYSLTVAADHSNRKHAAAHLLDLLRQHRPVMVAQGRIVVQELVRVAILWHEQWHECLEEGPSALV